MENRNNVTELVLLGLTQNPEMQKILFVLFLLIYIATILGNLLIMVTIAASRSLGSPMYFFLAYLSFTDPVYSTTIAPKMITDLLHEEKTISFQSCMTQVFIDHLFAGAEGILLVVMAYDQYVSISKPLHYLIIMKQTVCVLMLLVVWTGDVLHSLVQLLYIYQLPFCGPNVIDNIVCDMYPLLKLACADTHLIGFFMTANGGAICTVVFFILLVSYGVILQSLKTHGLEGNHKAFYTCASRMMVVILFFVPCIFVYARPILTLPIDKLVTVVLTFITPMLNPLTYTLRNAEIKNAMRKLWSKNVTLVGRGCVGHDIPFYRESMNTFNISDYN
ncbi:olfactory receptor 4A15-like isoform X2 [Oryx dammah]|uniref:olfactory receptor 4A15-like isoform X2 n=1 Tax=Oryx dammah TaxID=59534 RepID=UPI001A9AD63A|nr:olfactory receptor 4A15-like isoform X2 [Oryx dammah]